MTVAPPPPSLDAVAAPVTPSTVPIRRYTRSGVVTGLLTFVGLLLLPLFAVSGTPREGATSNLVLAWLIILYSSALLAHLTARGGSRVLRLAYASFIYVFMGIAVFAQLWTQQYPMSAQGTGAYTTAELRRALLAVILGILVFEIAYQVFNARRRGRTVAPAAPQTRRWRVSEVRVVVLGAIGLLFTVYLLSRTGIAPYFTSRQAAGLALLGGGERQQAYEAASKVNVLYGRLAQGPCLISLAGMIYGRRYRLWPPRGPLWALTSNVVMTLVVVANVIINNPISNSRVWASTVGIALVSVIVPLQRDVAVRWMTIISLVVLMFGFTSLQAFRFTGGAKAYSVGFQGDLISSGTYSEYPMEIVGLRWLRDNPHTFGYQLLGSVLVFVPRSVWPEKPLDTGGVVLDISNLAASLWTEGEVEAGPAGIIIYFAVLGAGVAALDGRFARSRPGQLRHMAIPILAASLSFFLRGSMLSAMSLAYVLVGSLALIAARVPTSDGDGHEPEPEHLGTDTVSDSTGSGAVVGHGRRKARLT